jgi:hypothetical protein
MFFPPNMTINHQLEDMGMVTMVKVGYESSMLRTQLQIFIKEGGFEMAAQQQGRQPCGC